MTMTERSFRDAYRVLQQHAETLRDQAEPNIDDLLTIVTESVEAYKVCKERIDAVETALKAALNGVGVGASGQPTPTAGERPTDAQAMKTSSSGPTQRAVPPPAESEASDDDIPF